MEAHGDNYPKKKKLESYKYESVDFEFPNTKRQKKVLKKLNKDIGLSALANMKYANADEAKDVDMQKVGMKYDKGKLRYELMPPASLAGVVRILTFGAEKYADYNWKLVEPVSRYYGALLRHLEAVREGEWLDPESGQPHLDHVLCNAVFLRELKWKGE